MRRRRCEPTTETAQLVQVTDASFCTLAVGIRGILEIQAVRRQNNRGCDLVLERTTKLLLQLKFHTFLPAVHLQQRALIPTLLHRRIPHFLPTPACVLVDGCTNHRLPPLVCLPVLSLLCSAAVQIISELPGAPQQPCRTPPGT